MYNRDKIVKRLSGTTAKTRAAALDIADAANAKLGRSITEAWGYNPASRPEHSSGRAVDFMVYQDKALGDWIADYAQRNAKRLGIVHIIWYQRIWSVARSKEGWRSMPNRGSGTANHKDHPHIYFNDTYKPGETTMPHSKPLSLSVLNAGIESGKPSGNVRLVQEIMNKVLGSGLTEDGIWGEKTRKAYSTFQQEQGWKGTRKGQDADGYPGPASLTRLFQLDYVFHVTA